MFQVGNLTVEKQQIKNGKSRKPIRIALEIKEKSLSCKF